MSNDSIRLIDFDRKRSKRFLFRFQVRNIRQLQQVPIQIISIFNLEIDQEMENTLGLVWIKKTNQKRTFFLEFLIKFLP